MQKLNILNYILAGIIVILAGLLVFKVYSYKASERFYYISSVSNPTDFPIHIYGIWFKTQGDEYSSASFHKSSDRINAFYSSWGVPEYDNTYKPQFLPEKLFLEYVDFKTQKYYLDTIVLPKLKMIELFNAAGSKGKLQDLSVMGPKMGLRFQVGIANEGNVVFWVVGNKYEEEFYRLQLSSRSAPKTITATKQKTGNWQNHLLNVFEEIPDSIQNNIRRTEIKAQYKDSIPVYFHHLEPENKSLK